MKLENEYLYIELSTEGGEVTKIYDKQKSVDILWDANPTFWKRHSPILFPNVGKTYKNTVKIKGTQYPTSQHGFARDSVFTCIKEEENMVTFLLCSNEETRKLCPFDFELYLSYILEAKALRVQWEVKNPSDETIYFTIGGHPAFQFANGGETKQEYCLKFPGKESLTYLLINPEYGTGEANTTFELNLQNEMCPLNEEMFEKDALIFDQGQIEEVWLCHKDGSPYVGLRCEGFPNFGIWSVKEAPFVCLEPWAGRCDNTGFAGEITEKPGINPLEPQGSFRREYQIIVS